MRVEGFENEIQSQREVDPLDDMVFSTGGYDPKDEK